MKISEKIKVLRRKKLGINQSELAELVHATRQAVSGWERGETIPSMESIKLLVEVFGVSYDVLMDETIDLNDPKQWEIHVEKKVSVEEPKKPVEQVQPVVKEPAPTKLTVPVYAIDCKMVTKDDKTQALHGLAILGWMVLAAVAAFFLIGGIGVLTGLVFLAALAAIVPVVLILFGLIALIRPLWKIIRGGDVYFWGSLSEEGLALVEFNEGKIRIPISKVKSIETLPGGKSKLARMRIRFEGTEETIDSDQKIVEPSYAIKVFESLKHPPMPKAKVVEKA